MFRKEALQFRKSQWRGHALLIRGIPLWTITIVSLIFFILLLSLIISGTYTRRITAIGEVSSNPRAVTIYSGVQGVVVEQFVIPGQRVTKGDTLYRIDVSRSTRRGAVNENQRRDIENQIVRVDNIILRLTQSRKQTVESLEKQRDLYSTALKNSADIVHTASEGVNMMKQNLSNYTDYQKRGLINRDQLNNQATLYYGQQSTLLSLIGQNDQNALQLTSVESQIQVQAAEFDNRIYQMEMQRYELEKELLSADAEGETDVRARTDGTVDSLSVTVGQMVSGGDSLLQLLPDNIDGYHVVLWVPNDAVPYLSKGDRVNVRYEAFPVEKFGQFAAKITFIASMPASPSEMHTWPAAPKGAGAQSIPWFKVIVRPEQQHVNWSGKTLPLGNGMKVRCTLFLEQRKIYQWMLTPFYDMKRSAGGPVNE